MTWNRGASNEGCQGESWGEAMGGSEVWTVDLEAMKVRIVGVGGGLKPNVGPTPPPADLDTNDQSLIMNLDSDCDAIDEALGLLRDEVATLMGMHNARSSAGSRR